METTKIDEVYKALETILNFSSEESLTKRIANIESNLKDNGTEFIKSYIKKDVIDETTLQSAIILKKAIGQIDVIIHALGIINTLPYILEQDEKIQYLSLGAGNTGREFDLETNKRIAEFKFISWSGKSDTIRQNNTFKDFFQLVEASTEKKRNLYILDKEKVLNFFNNNRALKSVLSKNQSVKDNFYKLYGDKYKTVSQYYSDKKHLVEIIDLSHICKNMFD